MLFQLWAKVLISFDFEGFFEDITSTPDVRYDIGNANNCWVFQLWLRAHCVNAAEILDFVISGVIKNPSVPII